jgi:Leucine-rich repeat (LRR) protein
VFYSSEKREKTKELNIRNKNLVGELDLSDFGNLKVLYCSSNELVSLNLGNCSQLEEIHCQNNLLTNISLPNNSTNLKKLDLSDNNFSIQDLSFLVKATNLEELRLGNDNQERIKQGIYNCFAGSLDYLSKMEKLKKLTINNTDLNGVNLDKLPESLKEIKYSSEYRLKCKLIQIFLQLQEYESKNIP